MRKFLRACLAALLLAGLPAIALAQSVQLSGSICPVDTAAPPAGQASPHGAYIMRRTLTANETSASLEFEVALKMPNFAGLQMRVAHGQRISPQEMAATYQPSAADYAQVTAWLTAQGFTITRRENTHLAVFARGTVSQLHDAMQLTFARVSNGSAEFTSAITAPTIPVAIAPLLVGINGLQPHILPRRHLILRTNSLTGTNPPYLPSQIAQAYNASSLYTSSITGSGQAIAIVIDTFPATSDLSLFWSDYSVSQSLANISLINVSGTSTLPSPSGEETLDTEWSSSIAPGARVRVYAAGSLEFTALDAAYEQVYTDATSTPSLAINQMTMSYGLGEQYEGEAQVNTDDQYFVMLAGAGVGLFASSGDYGATPNSSGNGGNGIEEPEYPASDPYVTGVGGTSLTLTSSGSANTEVVWNDSYGASGGGESVYFSRPFWQSGTGVPSANVRCVPDISASADPVNGAVVVLNGKQVVYGGTSWSSPTWAGFCALINQSRVNAGLLPTGQLAPLLYPYIGTANFRDITSGNNIIRRHGYSAGVGYDLCSGIGVPNVANLASTLTPLTAPSFTDGPPSTTGEIGTAYSFTYTASGSPVPTFALATGSQLPTGITLTSGILSGTPTQSGEFTGTVTASNGVNPVAQQAYTLAIDQPPAFTSAPINANASTTSNVDFTLAASGYPAPTFTVTSGNLPTGLTLSPDGTITGTPSQIGTFTAVITANNGVGNAVTQDFTITVLPAGDTPTLQPAALVLLAAALGWTAMRLLPARAP